MWKKILTILIISILVIPLIEGVCITKPFYQYKFCPEDGYIKQMNGYKILNYNDIEYYLHSKNLALQTIGYYWFNVYVDLNNSKNK